jgi:hypothetical protein
MDFGILWFCGFVVLGFLDFDSGLMDGGWPASHPQSVFDQEVLEYLAFSDGMHKTLALALFYF